MFDKNKDLGGIILGHMTEDGAKEDSNDDDKGGLLKDVAAELIRAVHAKDEDAVRNCLEAFADHCQMAMDPS